MNSIEIDNQMRELECFKGVIAKDLVPKVKIKQRPIGFIINTDKSTEEGQHWVALFVDDLNIAEYFDSFGFSNISNEIKRFLRINEVKKVNCNKFQIQGLRSISCGAFCILYLKLRCNSFSFLEFIRVFSNNFIQNDSIVSKILE